MQKQWPEKEELQLKSCLTHNFGMIRMKLEITQTKSIIDRPVPQKRTIKALGLGRPNYKVIHNDTPQIRGMINKVSHLVKFNEIED
jgi:large subunit ribosomal protein L30